MVHLVVDRPKQAFCIGILLINPKKFRLTQRFFRPKGVGLQFIHFVVTDTGHNPQMSRVFSQYGGGIVIPLIRYSIAGLDGEQLCRMDTGFSAEAVLQIEIDLFHESFHFCPTSKCPCPRIQGR